MQVDKFDFNLPNKCIALHPVRPRDSARMLIVDPKTGLSDKIVTDLLDILRSNDVLVINDTKVIPAELKAKRYRGENQSNISFNLHKRVDAATWAAFARPAKRLKIGDKLEFFSEMAGASEADKLRGKIDKIEDGGQVFIKFDVAGAILDEAIKSFGAMPLPPYIGAKRKIEKSDLEDYQTIYAKEEGAVAAPTAGLHFTDELMEKITAKNIAIEHVTLHVGAGTFLPVKVDNTDEHKMHSEWGVVSKETVEKIKQAKEKGGRVVAVGTTSLRLLESAARKTGKLEPFCGDTDIFITPGYKFNSVDILMTNFHLPRSTLFMLVSAFSGFENMHNAYAHAIENEYRFYSYGDASLLFRKD